MGRRNVQEVRPTTVAGKYYPADAEFLAKMVDEYLGAAPEESEVPKAVIAPHGGYIYSGPVAGSAFRNWMGHAPVERVVVIGPSHFYDFPGIALPDTSVFVTPLGELEVDLEAAEALKRFNFIQVFEGAHEPEHAIEVELPFLQKLFEGMKIVPLVTGSTSADQVARVIDLVWGGPETLIVVSSDLSHYHDYGSAQRYDAAAARMIESFDFTQLTADQACGHQSIRGLLKVAMKREMRCVVRDLRNSGDTAGPTSEVTGYGAFHFFEL